MYNRSVSSNLIIKRIGDTDRFTIDALESSVIEFARSFVKDGIMKPGRIWAHFSYIDHDKNKLMAKEPGFEQWYETLANWIRKSWKHIDRLVYASPRAMTLREQGVKFADY